MNQPRAMSVQRSRNPILGEEPPKFPYPHKAHVPTYLIQEKLLSDRPRGIARGLFSSHLQGSLHIGNDPCRPYRPFKRQVEHQESGLTEDPLPSRRQSRPATPSRNPIVQDESFEQPVCYSRRIEYREQPSRRACEPEESFPTPSKQEAYARRNSSSIFRQDPDRDLFGTHKRAIPAKPESTGPILQYSYALPYREANITAKVV